MRVDDTTPTLLTQRLILRPWRDEDLPGFAMLNADPRVMTHLPKTLTPAESDAMALRIQDHFVQHGFGLWAVEVPDIADFIGFVGLSVPTFETHFTPCVEMGWRLAYAYWGNGYASEAALTVMRYGYEQVGLTEIVSFTVPGNLRSRRVMERIGMQHNAEDDFDHPNLAPGHALRRHVLYRKVMKTGY